MGVSRCVTLNVRTLMLLNYFDLENYEDIDNTIDSISERSSTDRQRPTIDNDVVGDRPILIFMGFISILFHI